jgi:hypothetical protein
MAVAEFVVYVDRLNTQRDQSENWPRPAYLLRGTRVTILAVTALGLGCVKTILLVGPAKD